MEKTNGKEKPNNMNNINETSDKIKKLKEGSMIGKKCTKILKVLATTSLNDIVPIYRWWEDEVKDDEESEIKWKTLQHNGVVFPPKYEPHGVKVKYKVVIFIILGRTYRINPTSGRSSHFLGRVSRQ